MFNFYSSILTGKIRPNLITGSDLEKVLNCFYERDDSPTFLKRFASVCFSNTAFSRTEVNNSHDLSKFLSDIDEDIDFMEPREWLPLDLIADYYGRLIKIEFEITKLNLKDELSSSIDVRFRDQAANERISQLRLLAKKVNEDIEMYSNDDFMEEFESRLCIYLELNDCIIDLIQFISEFSNSDSQFPCKDVNKQVELNFSSSDRSVYLRIINAISDKEDAEQFKEDFFSLLKKSSLNEDVELGEIKLSIGNELFNFYQNKYRGGKHKVQISNLSTEIHNWDKVLITSKLIVNETIKNAILFEVGDILLPLINREINRLHSTPKSSCIIPTGFRSKLLIPQIDDLYEKLKGTYIDEVTEKKHFRAIFDCKSELKEFKKIEWIKPRNLLAYFIDNLLYIEEENNWAKAKCCFEDANNLKQARDNYLNKSKTGLPKNFEEILSIIKPYQKNK